MLARIFWGLALIIIGFLAAWKTEWIVQSFGRWEWAEVNLGSDGGSRLAYKLIAILAIIVGMLTMTGLIRNVGLCMLRPFFPQLSL